jgi:Na+/proline symporter
MLVLGGSATVTDLTGMSTIAVSVPNPFFRRLSCAEFMVSLCLHPLSFFLQACFLIPLGVSIYVVVGGMRSTLLCD